MVRLLVENGADVNIVNNQNTSGLIFAIDKGNYWKAVELLLVKESLIRKHFISHRIR